MILNLVHFSQKPFHLASKDNSRATARASLLSLWESDKTGTLFLQYRMSIRMHLTHLSKELPYHAISAITISLSRRIKILVALLALYIQSVGDF